MCVCNEKSWKIFNIYFLFYLVIKGKLKEEVMIVVFGWSIFVVDMLSLEINLFFIGWGWGYGDYV